MSIREMKKRQKGVLLKEPLFAVSTNRTIYVSLDEEKNTVKFDILVRANGRSKIRFSRKFIKRMAR